MATQNKKSQSIKHLHFCIRKINDFKRNTKVDYSENKQRLMIEMQLCCKWKPICLVQQALAIEFIYGATANIPMCLFDLKMVKSADWSFRFKFLTLNKMFDFSTVFSHQSKFNYGKHQHVIKLETYCHFALKS